ncbi:MAG TPA: Ig domain-containing protein, partial [Candidatus Sumerlaeota bacterium]|nr:Ig domain-containing protein [Candidatus Sumerlaeota bacterium]
MNTKLALILILILSSLNLAYAETLSIDAPICLPKDTGHQYYSPYVGFQLSGLQNQTYTLKVWLLDALNWNCASTNWCEFVFDIDNTKGDKNETEILTTFNMDVYNYTKFDWVAELYDSQNNQVAKEELFADGFDNRAPQLSAIGNKQAKVGEKLEFIISATDPENGDIAYSARKLPDGAELDPATGLFRWTPKTPGIIKIIFEAKDNAGCPLSDAEMVEIAIAPADITPTPEPTPTPTPTP